MFILIFVFVFVSAYHERKDYYKTRSKFQIHITIVVNKLQKQMADDNHPPLTISLTDYPTPTPRLGGKIFITKMAEKG